MNIFANMTTTDWIVMIVVLLLIGGAYWLIDDSRKRGMKVGGKFCGGCPHYCRMDRDCDGNPKQTQASDTAEETAG